MNKTNNDNENKKTFHGRKTVCFGQNLPQNLTKNEYVKIGTNVVGNTKRVLIFG